MTNKCNKSAIWEFGNTTLCVCVCARTHIRVRPLSLSKETSCLVCWAGCWHLNHNFRFVLLLSLASSFLTIA